MAGRLYKGDPLTPEERAEFEEDLISFCDRELDLLGDLRGLDVLYAGGSSILWLEGLSQRIGEGGRLTVLDSDAERLEESSGLLEEVDLTSPVRLVAGDIFEPPFGPRTFDLVYSAGFFHELDVRERVAEDALAALVTVTRPGGRISTSDFIDAVPAVQLEDEEIEAGLAREISSAELYGIGPPARLVALHEKFLTDVRWHISPPRNVRHLDKLILAEEEPASLSLLPSAVQERLRRRRELFLQRVRREGYTRPATLYVEGQVPDG
ncbi:MAG: class I SAM-dependent methyltransferase [Actinobacteria bacterium]|nr:class I SAM-dependent methyltransferase [Actinomycetota bacterium]